MRRMAGLVLAALLALPVTGAAAEPGEGVRARLAEAPVLRGQFEQRKQLHGFRNPLVSRGDFLLVRGRGVAWDTREPFPSSTVLTRERLLTRLPDGSERIVFDGGDSPGAAAVASLLMALVAGDLDALAEQFTLEESTLADGRWQLLLQPIAPELAQVFTRIALRGDRHVDEVDLEERNGDRSLLRFTGLSDQPAAPRADEAARFD